MHRLLRTSRYNWFKAHWKLKISPCPDPMSPGWGGEAGTRGRREHTHIFAYLWVVFQWVACPLFYHCPKERLILDMLRNARRCTKCLYIYFETVLLGSSGSLQTLHPPDSACQVLGLQPMQSHSVLSVFYFLILCSLKDD